MHECLVGTVEMGLRSPPTWISGELRPYPYISNLAVGTEFRRQGVAQQLLISCERTALDWGVEDIYLHVLENNHQARQLYLKRGYRLHQVESSICAWLLRQPRRLFLRKNLSI